MSKNILRNLQPFNKSDANEDEEKESKDDGDTDDTDDNSHCSMITPRRRCCPYSCLPYYRWRLYTILLQSLLLLLQ